MKRILPLLILIPLFAQDPPGAVVWKAADLRAKEKELAGKLSDKHVASMTLDTFGNHFTMLAHREGDGEVEMHDKVADVFYIISGDATLILGGKVAGSYSSGPGETRGTSITGGVKKTLATGDAVHIPAKVPHQMLVAKGKKITYFVVKVEEK